MPVKDVSTDRDNLTLTITAEFAAPVDRVWAVYADPRQLERVWGPPGYPATFVEHSLTPGGRMSYHMTSPEGEKYPGWWEITAVDEPRRFTFRDGFADQNYEPLPDMPVSENEYRFTATDNGTEAVFVSTYADADALEKVLQMGVVEGSSAAIGQIDDLLAA